MIDGTNLNQLTGSRQLLRAFGGINETYSCSEAELSAALNFSGRGFPALQFEAVSGDIGLTETDDKYISRITLRLDAQTHSVVTLAASYDGGPWETLRTAAATGDHARLNLPFEPRRHDTMRLKLSGTGQIALRSMAFTLAGTTGGRVTGAGPRK